MDSRHFSQTPDVYIEDTAADFYAELLAAAARSGDVRRAYTALGNVFRRAADQKLRHNSIKFAGLFAKTDYLIKENGITPPLSYYINDTRVRLRRQHERSESDLKQTFPYDLKNVCRFISAVYGGAPVPAELSAMLPASDLSRDSGELLGDCIRVVADCCTESVLTATGEHGNRMEIPLSHGWEHIAGLVSPGAQLNLVRPRMEEGVIRPELIIYEPDYLVDISAVAACFESYGNTPYTYLINKIKPAPMSVHTMLGNFAGQLLDEAVHSSESDYTASVKEFFRRNALAIAACPDTGTDFHKAATAQRHNIRQAVGTVLPSEVNTYQPEETMLEPSFFSEMLGIQGRMDFLQMDNSRPDSCLLIEQKSGKGAFPPGPDPDTPRHQEKHYVQLLLYMALLRYNYSRSNSAIRAFLLYSRYTNSLLKLGPAPALLREAIMLRNRIARCEQSYAAGGISVLERLTPDALNTRHVSGTLWNRYTRPQLEALLQPIHTASPLERAYYFRFMTFLETEHLLSKIGNKTKENSGFAAKWHDTLEEKLIAGNIYYDMAIEKLESSGDSGTGIATITLQMGGQPASGVSNFRQGDIVILYSYVKGMEPDARKTVVFRASVAGITSGSLTLRLRNPQTDRRVFHRPPGHAWAVEHDLFESSFGSLYRGMHTFLSAPGRRRELLLTLRRPETDPSVTLRGDYGAFNELVLRAMRARDFFLVIGPPGTGKTSFGMLNILREELLRPSASVLLTAYTNRAVDEICSKLTASGIDFVRMGSPLACAGEYRGYLLENHVKSCANVSGVRKLISTTRVVCATVSSLNSNTSLFALKHFDLAIIDEASQILEPHIIGLLSAATDGSEAISRFVLIGDHKQLPAVVQQTDDDSRVSDPTLREIDLTDCRDSLFERLLRRYRDDASVTYMLTRQGRMHREIARFPSEAFYGGQLHTVPLKHQEAPLPPHPEGGGTAWRALSEHRVAFIASRLPDDDLSDKVNTAEAGIIASVVLSAYRLYGEKFNPDTTVGVIVPYRNQIAAVRDAIAASGITCLQDITIDTVERYQGSQRDIIIYGFTVRKRYQLNFLTSNVFEEDGALIDRKLNVAITRAREHLVLTGNPRLLSENAVFASLIQYIRDRHAYFE